MRSGENHAPKPGGRHAKKSPPAHFAGNTPPFTLPTSRPRRTATGGNAINFHTTNLHSYSDSVTATNATAAARQTTPRAFAQTFIASPPPGWQTGSFISGWAVQWANEVLPIATEAHARLTFHANA